MMRKFVVLTILSVTSLLPFTGTLSAQDDSSRARNPLIRAYEDLLNQSEFDDDGEIDQIRTMLRDSDALLTRVKIQNALALKNVNRQAPGIGAPLPNILILSIDDLSTDSLRTYGSESAETPQIDALAESGVTLTNFHAGSPLESDAFWCLLTGQHSGAIVRDADLRPLLSNGSTTLISQLWHAGYTTGFFGGWPLAGPLGPNECGSDIFIGWRDLDSMRRFVPETILVNDVEQELKEDSNTGANAWTVSTFQALAALERRDKRRPFAWMIRYQGLDFPAGCTAASEIDRELVRLLDRLEQQGLRDSTLIWLVGETAQATAGFDSLRDSLKTNQQRVPSIISYPARFPKAVTREAVTGVWDIVPTLATLSRDRRFVRQPHGVSLYNLLVSGTVPADRLLYWSVPVNKSSAIQAVRKNQWKAVLPAGSREIELYDLVADPEESNDVSADHPEIVRQMIRPSR